MHKLKMHSVDGVALNIEKIGELFPNAVTEVVRDGKVERAVDFEVLRQELSDVVVDGREERYQFTWPDKKKAILAANAPVPATLRPVVEESVGRGGAAGGFDSENLYIEGDNLEVLKLLRETYLGKVKMIYIDPPYNTGNDFIYSDDFAEDKDEYMENSGQFDEEGNRMTPNLESNGRFHTDWLNMIYPRLKVAKDLLTGDGLIFISIDDNEIHNLRKICDDIFGARNYLNQFAWVSNLTGRQISGCGAAKTWESILVYAQNIDNVGSLKVNVKFAKDNMPDSYKGFNKDIRSDNEGTFAVGDTLYNHNRKFNEETRQNLVFSIFYNPQTEEILTGDIDEAEKEGFVKILPHKNGDGVHKYHAWRWSRDKIAREKDDLIVRPTVLGRYEVYTKIRDYSSTLLKDIITNISNGDNELQTLFDNKKYFDYPKSVALLKLLTYAVGDNQMYVCDFFSGSATTAHAVMQLNAEDGGKRKFIMVQIPEACVEKSEAFKAGYKNVCEIGKERIRRAGKKIKEENPLTTQELDIGFRCLRLDTSNMKDVYYRPDELGQAELDGLIDNVKEDRTPEDLLFQVMLELGAELSSKIDEKVLDGKKVLCVEDNYVAACFDKEVTDETVKAMAKMKPQYAVLRDNSMESDSVAVNFEQIFKTYSPDTKLRVL